MKITNPIKKFGFLGICTVLLWSCNNDKLKELEDRIAELENQEITKDSVLFETLIINSQSQMNLMAGRGIKNIFGGLEIHNCSDLSGKTG